MTMTGSLLHRCVSTRIQLFGSGALRLALLALAVYGAVAALFFMLAKG